ncbi:hypothetical protein Dimus_031844, partial [Dionaea muscipula]
MILVFPGQLAQCKRQIRKIITMLESSILFAGRQVHPFFSQWKVGKSNLENYDPESNCGMTIGKDTHFKFGPIDVLEDIKCSFVEHRNYKIVYMRYASLFFLVGVDNDE